jgi:hypothetical protein
VREEEAAVANTRAVAAVLLVGFLGTARLDSTQAGPVDGDTPLAPAFPRVRSEDAVLSGLIQQATDRSPTFRRLLAAIQKTDGLVYVQRGRSAHAEQDATIKAAVALLPEAVRSTLPEIVLVAEPESGGPQPQAYVEQGSTRIYVNTNGQGYLGAAGGNKDALKFLASVIVHEHAHALHGASEAEAYTVQIDTLKTLKAPKGIVRAVEEAAAHVNQ